MLGISTQAVYQTRQRQTAKEERFAPIKDWIQEYRMLMPRIGGRKLYYLLKDKLAAHNIKMGRDIFFGYLRNHRLLVKPRRSYTKTTNSKHWLKKHPNLLKDEEKPVQVESVLVADITYVKSSN